MFMVGVASITDVNPIKARHGVLIKRLTKQKKPRQQKPREAASTLIESAIAFILIVATASLIYTLGRRASPKPVQSETERSAYACGEKATFHGLKVNVSLYKFLIYFVIFDSSIILIAFASLVGQGRNVILLILYLFLMLASGLIMLEGGKD